MNPLIRIGAYYTAVGAAVVLLSAAAVGSAAYSLGSLTVQIARALRQT